MPVICIEEIEALRSAAQDWDDVSARLRAALKPFHVQVPELFPTRFEELSIKDCSTAAHTLIKLERIFIGGSKWSHVSSAPEVTTPTKAKVKRTPRDEIS